MITSFAEKIPQLKPGSVAKAPDQIAMPAVSQKRYN